jgi:hypothetical protein
VFITSRDLTNPQAIEFDGEKLFLLEGVIADLQVAPSTENLLEQIQQGSKGKAALMGAAAGLVGMSQTVATSSALVFYDGEDTNNFAALIKNKGVVCGTFRAADSLVKGEQVKCVVSKRGDVYFAHSVLRTNSGAIMVPTMTDSGDRAYFRELMRTGRSTTVVTASLLCIFYLWSYFSDDKPPAPDVVAIALIFFLVVPPSVGYIMEYWNYKSTRDYGLHASAIFKALGIPRPDDFTLFGHWRSELPRSTFCLKSALEAHSKKYPEINQQNS